MFTVIICDKHIIDDCRGKFSMYLKPLYDNEDIAFCSWNTDGDTLEQAVPELKQLVATKGAWNVIVVNDHSTWNYASVDKLNPFNYVDSAGEEPDFKEFSDVLAYRKQKEEMLEKAISNPLTKISIWLCGVPLKSVPSVCYDGEMDFFESVTDGEEYFGKIDEMGLSAYDVEIDRFHLKRYEKCKESFGPQGELFNSPKSFIAVSERIDKENARAEASEWNENVEFEYSRFYVDNLYPDKMRYLIYDIGYINREWDEKKYFQFVSALLLIASNEMPDGSLRTNRVYKLHVDIDREHMQTLCLRYRAKLRATIKKIENMIIALNDKESEDVDPITARESFEKNITIPVSMEGRYERDDLLVNSSGVHLCADSANSDYTDWNERFASVSNSLVRYMREPRRAVKSAITGSFKKLNKIKDPRALHLTPWQKEDIEAELRSEENLLVRTNTSSLNDLNAFKNEIENTDKMISKALRYRTQWSTAIVILVAVLFACIAGFGPVFIASSSYSGALSDAVLFCVVSCFLFSLPELIALFWHRKKIKDMYKRFNAIIFEMLDDVDNKLLNYSEYISHACNIMRKYSVLFDVENPYEITKNILSQHKRNINDVINELNSLFPEYASIPTHTFDEAAYEHDFSQLTDYEYEIPYKDVKKEVVFIQKDYTVFAPVDFFRSVYVTREELYG